MILSTDQRISDYCEFVEALGLLGVESVCLPSSKYCYLGKTDPLQIVPSPRFLNIVKSFRPDFVLNDSTYYVPQIAKLVGRRSLFHMRGNAWNELYVDGAMNPSLFRRIYTHYLASINDWSIKSNYLVLPNSKWLETQVAQNLPGCPTQVLYVGVDPRKWEPGDNSRIPKAINVKPPAVAGVFQFNQFAKVSGLLKFTKVAKKMKDVNFYFAGTGPYLDLVKQECPSNMFLLGRLSEIQIKDFLERADLFVHPSGLDASPRSVKEASLMEKPIVASDEGGIPEIVKNGQTGYLCNVNEKDQWIERIRFLLDNPSVARKLGRNARIFVANNYNWTKIAKGFLRGLLNLREQ